MRFALSVFVTLAVAAGIVAAQDASPSAAKDAFDKAEVGLPPFVRASDVLTLATLDPKGLAPPRIYAEGSPRYLFP